MSRDERLQEYAPEMYDALCGALDVLNDYVPYHEATCGIRRLLRRIDDCELLSCPFCGSERVGEYTDGDFYGIECPDCGGRSGMSPTPADARANWNMRGGKCQS